MTTSSNKTLLVTGGSRSGKSQHVLTRFKDVQGKKVMIATAEALDEEMSARIKKHQAERGPDWTTVEEPIELPRVILEQSQDASVIVLDCLTLWLSNLLMRELTSDQILERTDELIQSAQNASCTVAFVTNEVGAGLVPDNPLGRNFRDLAGIVNQRFAQAFDEVVMMVSGIPMVVKASPAPGTSGKSSSNSNAFSDSEKEGLYKAIYKRRDMRHFLSDPIDPKVLGHVLHAAHNAGSVGFMQPWNFIVIDDSDTKKKVYQNFQKANEQGINKFKGERKALISSLKLEGILDAPINICITCDSSRMGPNVLGRNTMPETDLFSTCCAVQNLWLAARSEGLGVGWVSILDKEKLKTDLGIPESTTPVAYLCVGHCEDFYSEPMLQSTGWAKRLSLEDLVFYNRWKGEPTDFKAILEQADKNNPPLH